MNDACVSGANEVLDSVKHYVIHIVPVGSEYSSQSYVTWFIICRIVCQAALMLYLLPPPR